MERWVNEEPNTVLELYYQTEGRAYVLGLTASVKVSSELRPYHRSISSWRSGPTPGQHFDRKRETRKTL